jgi:general secretion pathway protein D
MPMKSNRFSALTIALASAAAAQLTSARPVSAQPTPTPTAGSAAEKPATGEDEALYSCKHKQGAVAVTFKPETELKDLITWVMGFTCKNFVLDPRIVSTGKKVTVIAPLKMSQEDAYRVFLVALSTMGLTVIPKGNVIRIVESTTAKSETIPIQTKGVPADQDEMVRYVLKPSYVQAETLRGALDSVRSTSGSVTAAGNVLIITDFASQVRDMMSLAKTLDVPGNNEGIYTIPVKHSDATQLAQKLNDILGLSAGGASASRGPVAPVGKPNSPGAPPAGGGPSGPGIDEALPSKILVDDRTNTLIVVSNEPGYLRVKALVDRLDILLDTEGGLAIRVYSLENALAKDLSQTLNNALQGRNQATGAKPGAPGAPGQPAAPTPTPQPQPGSAGEFGAALEGQVRIVNDDPTNSLIVTSSGRDYVQIKEVIHRLDQPRRQIFIEALIVEVNLDKTSSIGSSEHGGVPTSGSTALVLGGVENASGPNSLSPSSLAGLSGLLGGIVGSPLTNAQTFLGTTIPSYALLFQALATNNNTNVLSTPHYMALDNEKAEFSVGDNVPYQAGLSFGGVGLPSTGSTSTSSSLPVGSIGQNIQREKLTLDLNITPHISSGDSVRLEVEQNTKDLASKDPVLGPTWTERKLKTQVVVHDQETCVIGGLIQDHEIYGESKVPLLGDIPLLGYLFKYETKERKKTNLLILITPYIIRDRLDLESIKEKKEREYREFSASFSNLNLTKYEPNVDYSRKRGLVEEINRSLQSVEDDAAVLNSAGHRQYVQPGQIETAPSSIEAPDDNTHGTGQSAPVPPDRPNGGR